MKKKSFLIGVVVLMLAAVFVLPAGTMAQSKSTMNIRFSTWHVPVSREVKTVWIPMLEELKKRSNGRITYTLCFPHDTRYCYLLYQIRWQKRR